MKRKNILSLTAGLLLFSMNLNAQYTELSGKELESTIYKNHQNGLPNNSGLFTGLLFKVKDYSLLNTNFERITQEIQKRFQLEQFELKNDTQQLSVVFDKTKSSTDDFIQILKEVLSGSGVYLIGYDERTLLKNQ